MVWISRQGTGGNFYMKWNKICCIAAALFLSGILLEQNGEAAEAIAPVSLEQCVDMALQQNLTVQMAQDDADKALASVKSAKGATGLSINAANTDYWKKTTSSTHPNNTPSAPFSLVTNQVTMSLPIYNGGKMEKSVDAAVLSYANAQENQKISDAQIKYQTTVDYYKVCCR
jgi:outer membrane protein TolC